MNPSAWKYFHSPYRLGTRFYQYPAALSFTPSNVSLFPSRKVQPLWHSLGGNLTDSSLHISRSLSRFQLDQISFNILSQPVFISSPYLHKRCFLYLKYLSQHLPSSLSFNFLLPSCPPATPYRFRLISKEHLLEIRKKNKKTPHTQLLLFFIILLIILHSKLPLYIFVPLSRFERGLELACTLFFLLSLCLSSLYS